LGAGPGHFRTRNPLRQGRRARRSGPRRPRVAIAADVPPGLMANARRPPLGAGPGLRGVPGAAVGGFRFTTFAGARRRARPCRAPGRNLGCGSKAGAGFLTSGTGGPAQGSGREDRKARRELFRAPPESRAQSEVSIMKPGKLAFVHLDRNAISAWFDMAHWWRNGYGPSGSCAQTPPIRQAAVRGLATGALSGPGSRKGGGRREKGPIMAGRPPGRAGPARGAGSPRSLRVGPGATNCREPSGRWAFFGAHDVPFGQATKG